MAPKLLAPEVFARAHYAWWFRARGQMRRVIDTLGQRVAHRTEDDGHELMRELVRMDDDE